MSEFITRGLHALFLAAILLPAAHAQFIQQGSKLTGSDAVGSPSEGSSVAVSADGNTAIVGGDFDSGGVGAAWVWVRTNGIWSQQGPKLVGTGAVGPASRPPAQGTSVGLSADGNTAVVGGPGDNSQGLIGATGATWVFTRTNGVWSQQGPKLVGAGAVGYPGQGISVAISADGNTAIAGGPFDNGDTGDGGVGAVWVFTRTNGVWSQQGNKLAGTGGVIVPELTAPEQGRSAALSGDGHTVIVGGPNDQPTGSVWVFVSAPVHFVVSAPASVTAGTPFSFTVTALDTNNSIVTGYTGTVHFYTTDAFGAVPADSTLINGVGTFTAILKSAIPSVPSSITVTDTANSLITGNSAPIAVEAAAASSFAFFATPPSAISGVPFNFSVAAYDQFGNLAPYPYQVQFTSSDGAAILPAASLLPAGVATFLAILKTAGSQTIAVTDTGNSSITGTSNPILVIGSSPSFNLAQGKAATQSSTFPGYATDGAAAAVDGNTDGNFGNGSVTATNFDTYPWWQVDLGSSAIVNAIVVWNRTDCCGSRLNDYWVFVSETPFLATDTPFSLQNRAGTFASHRTVAPNPSTIITASGGAQGRYVRVQLGAGATNILSLAEVQVFGTPVSSSGSNLALGRPATQSSTIPGYLTDGAGAAVDGNTDGNFFDGSVTGTNADPNAWWQVDLGASATVSSIAILESHGLLQLPAGRLLGVRFRYSVRSVGYTRHATEQARDVREPSDRGSQPICRDWVRQFSKCHRPVCSGATHWHGLSEPRRGPGVRYGWSPGVYECGAW
jgi:hypothetical protein